LGLFGHPTIDSGTNDGAPNVDKDGESRPKDGNGDGVATTDMGAYESREANSPPAADAGPNRNVSRACYALLSPSMLQ